MRNANLTIGYPRSHCKPSTAVRLHKTESHADRIRQWSRKLADSPSTQLPPKSDAIDEATRRWPGIAVLTERHLDDELGVAVYFTFPGGKHMAVWFSGADDLGIVPDDRPCWRAFTCKHDSTPVVSGARHKLILA